MNAYDRNSTRDSSRDDGSTSNRSTFRVKDIRSADLGISFDRSAREGLLISGLSDTGLIGNVGFSEWRSNCVGQRPRCESGC
jgi:hypothetical protein